MVLTLNAYCKYNSLVQSREKKPDKERGMREGGKVEVAGGHLRCLFLLIKLMEKDEEVAFNLG